MQNQIPNGWQKVKLGDVALLNPPVSVRKNEDCSYIPMENLDWNKKFVIPQTSKAYKGGAKFIENDILFARITPCLENGKIGRAKGLKDGIGFGSTEYFVVRGKEGISDTDFLYYLCRTYKVRQTAINSMLGASGRQRADIDSLQSYELKFPDFPEQKRISSILSEFDGKIEVNNIIAKTLEEMAEVIFQEWFVKFRFPRHEKMKFVDSELGKIPTGWHVGSFSEIVDISKESISPNKDKDEDFLHYSLPAYDTQGLPVSEKGINILSNKFLMPKECILISKLNPRIPRIWLPEFDVNTKSIASTEFIVLVSNENATKEFIYSFCISKYFQNIFQGRITGTSTSHQRVRPDDLLNIQLVIPPKDIIVEYNTLSRPMYMSIQKLKRENQKLAALRDLILPKLMNGAIRV